MKFIEHLFQRIWIRRSIAFCWHLAGVVLSYFAAFEIRSDLGMSPEKLIAFRETFVLAVIIFAIMVVTFRLYEGLWRFFTFHDCVKIALVFLLGTFFLMFAVYISRGFSFEDFPRLVFPINYVLLVCWEIGGRGAIRLFREWNQGRKSIKDRISERYILAGNLDECDEFIRSVSRQRGGFGKVVGILTDWDKHQKTSLHGVSVLGRGKDVAAVLRSANASNLVILPPFTAPRKMKELVDTVNASELVCEFRVLPSLKDITAGNVDVGSIRRVSIEDLLQRKPNKLDQDILHSFVEGKRIMVTGAGGSIGSEICRQVLNLSPKSLTLFDSSEYLLFEIERELKQQADEAGVELYPVAGDVVRSDQLTSALEKCGGIDVIYHAAAYKHVHLMEKNPVACFQNNVLGTHSVALVAEECGVGEFVLVSTDKAVRPTSMMGASKRLAERIIIERPESETHFKAVRFGNVLGSSGSVIPIFKQQIEEGGPVTVTSREVTRYFMTIPEAVELVIAAGAVAEDRRICVLEMGEPMKIDSLARRMIKLSGFIPDVDIPIVYTGLRPGEKEFEELLTDDEGVVRTDHDRIWVVKKSDDNELPPLNLGQLIEALDEGDYELVRDFAHDNIPGSLLK